MDEATEAIIEGLATHKLVPFFGAGVSIGQLKVDWQAISDAMAEEIALALNERSDFTAVAERFYATVGERRFAEFLRSYLIVEEFDDVAAWPHIFLLTLNAGLLYTTNQDNLFELASTKYGRPHRVIARVEDLAEAAPRDNLLIKYHGDLSRPETVIFTESSYRARIANRRHFLNIRLQSDLLSKGLLFVGYSMRDQNVRLLFQELREAFGGQMPPSYFIAYHYDEALEQLRAEFGLHIMDPQRYADIGTPDGEAFARYLKLVSENVHVRQHRNEIEEIFTPSVPRAVRVATIYDLSALERAADEMSFSEALHLFRNTLDRTFVSPAMAQTALNAFAKICEKAANDENLEDLRGALFNMTIPGEFTIEAVMHVMIAVNRCSRQTGFPTFILVCPQYPDFLILAGATLAIAHLKEHHIKVTEQFRRHLDIAANSFVRLPEDMQKDCRALYEWAWRDGGMNLPRHVIDQRGPFASPGFDEIMKRTMSHMPRGRA